MQQNDRENRLPREVLDGLYDEILDLQDGKRGQERVDIGNGNLSFLDWAVYYEYEEDKCVDEAFRPYEHYRIYFSPVLDTRQSLTTAIEELFGLRLNFGLEPQQEVLSRAPRVPECGDDAKYVDYYSEYVVQRNA